MILIKKSIYSIHFLFSHKKNEIKNEMDLNKPRYLTNDEIKSIVSKIPYYPYSTANKESSLFARESLIKFETFRLRNVRLTPLALGDYSKLYISNQIFSNIEYGTPVGGTAAEASSQASSQQVLNSFKVEVAKVATSSVEIFDEILEVRNRKVPKMAVYYKDNPGIEKIMTEKRIKLETITVNDLAIKQFIEAVENIYPNGRFPEWYDLYKSTILQGGNIAQFTWMLRLRINVDLMYKNRIMPKNIVKAIEHDGILKTVYSPLLFDDEEGGNYILFDIYVDNVNEILKTKFQWQSKLENQNRIFMYLNNIVKPRLSNMYVKGLNGIWRLQTVSISINYSLYSEIELTRYIPERKGEFIIKLNNHYMKLNFITIEDVMNMFKSIDVNDVHPTKEIINLIEYSDMELYVKLPIKPADWPADKNYTPINYISEMIKKDKEKTNEYRKLQLETKAKLYSQSEKEQDVVVSKRLLLEAGSIKIYREPSSIFKNSNQIYVETDGSDFSELIKMDDVDINRSHPNNLNDILKYFGIESVRFHIIKELIILIRSSGSDTYVDPRHISLMADWMTMFGFITPFTLKGMKYHKLGSLANAAFREPTKALHEESMFNKVDYLNNVSSAITIGKPIKLGAGIVDVTSDQNKIKKQLGKPKLKKEKINLDVTSKLVSLLLEGDYPDPKDNSIQSSLESSEKINGAMFLDIPISFGEASVVLSNDPFEIDYNIPALFPVLSPELRSAYNSAPVCGPAAIDTVIVEKEISTENPVNLISPLTLTISEGIRSANAVTEKPPEIEKLNVDTSFLDDLLS